MTAASVPEFSRVVRLADVPDGGGCWELSAGPDERAAVAARLGLLALELLEASVRLSWVVPGATLKAGGRMRARVVQACVVTLEPVASEIDEPVDILFTLEDHREGADRDWDAAEPLTTDSLDIGELVTEELSLDIEPYPRSRGAAGVTLGPGVSLTTYDVDPPEGEAGDSPFKALEKLKREG